MIDRASRIEDRFSSLEKHVSSMKYKLTVSVDYVIKVKKIRSDKNKKKEKEKGE